MILLGKIYFMNWKFVVKFTNFSSIIVEVSFLPQLEKKNSLKEGADKILVIIHLIIGLGIVSNSRNPFIYFFLN